jgi:hypothetical protein
MEFTKQYKEIFSLSECEKSCCVCFNNLPIIVKNETETSLADLSPEMFICNYIPDDILLKCPCNIHYLCVNCIRRIIHNYENHPINHQNSHFACPYPFKNCITPIGFPFVFEHSLIQNICRTESEWINYSSYASQYAFPGYYIFKCPMIYPEDIRCNADILIENDTIKNAVHGELIVECSQNAMCLKRFCYHCHKIISMYNGDMCYDCKYCYENENPNVLNYYFNKLPTRDLLNFEEHEYLYFNREITLEIAVSQISNTIHNVNTYMICPICQISIYKTEKCNGISHHGLERCYACGRVGFKVKGLGQHWQSSGIGGCFRFDHEDFVKNYVPSFLCTEYSCANHDRGDCNQPEHQNGIRALGKIRKISYVYHMFKSLNPSLRYQVFDSLFTQYNCVPTFMEYLPYKQSLVLLEKYKPHLRDFSEDILYSQLQCTNPKHLKFFNNKSIICPPETFVSLYTTSTNLIPYNTISTNTSPLQDILRFYSQPENDQLADNTVDMLMSSILNEINSPTNNESIPLLVHRDSVDITDAGYTMLLEYSDSDPDTE